MGIFYTGKGDDGTTGILGEGRVSKSDPQMDVIGNIDELTASIGLCRAVVSLPMTKEILLNVQRDLYTLMSELAATPENRDRFKRISPDHVTWLESHINTLDEKIDSPGGFIIPGDTLVGAHLDVARTVCRRAERGVVGWSLKAPDYNQNLLRYLNRLSSLLFVLELVESKAAGIISPTKAKE